MSDLGRPTKASETLLKWIYYLAEQGKTDKQIAKIVGVARSTLDKWKNEIPGFKVTLKKSKDIIDDAVEMSLLKRATGFECKDTHFATHKGKITDQREYTKYYPPSDVACIFWLKNRRTESWRDRKDIDLTNSDGKLRAVVELPNNSIDDDMPEDTPLENGPPENESGED